MALELYYTSSPRGLRPGTSGLCTVAMTRSMSVALASRLESLCGYRPPGEGVPIDRWPAALSHWAIDVGGVERHVLAAVRPVKPDHTMRSNTLAHFAVLHNSELDPAGAAWMLSQPETSAASWSGEPRLLDAERAMPRGGPAGARACHTWKSVAGDAGWAGVLANAAMLDPTKPATVICPMGTRVLDLVAEAMSLLPAAYRWRVTFTTYFTQPIAGVRCTWRFCLDGTSAAGAARQAGGLVIDACAPQACTRTGEFVDAARAGRDPVLVTPAAHPRPAERAATGRGASAEDGPLAIESDSDAEGGSRRRVPARLPVGMDEEPSMGSGASRTALAVAVVTSVVLLAIITVLVVLLRTTSLEAAALEARASKAEQERDSLQQSGSTVEELQGKVNALSQKLSEIQAERDNLTLERDELRRRLEGLEVQLRQHTPADAANPAPSAPATPAPAPSAAPQSDAAPSGGTAVPGADGAATASGSAGLAAVPMNRAFALKGRGSVPAGTARESAASEESVITPRAPFTNALEDSAIVVPWATAAQCGATAVTLMLSPALNSIGFAVLEGCTLAFVSGATSVPLARIERAAEGVKWNWIIDGVNRVKPALSGAGLSLPDDWGAVLGQMRLRATCADGTERTAAFGSPQARTWNVGKQNPTVHQVEIPRAIAAAAAIEWGGTVVVCGERAVLVDSELGGVSARTTRTSDSRMTVTLEWQPSAAETQQTECIGQLSAALAGERAIASCLDMASKLTATSAKSNSGAAAVSEDFNRAFEAWQVSKSAQLSPEAKKTFLAEPAHARMSQYASALKAQLAVKRSELAELKSKCDAANAAWKESLKGAVVLVRPERNSPPVARIDIIANSAVPSLPPSLSGAGAGGAAAAGVASGAGSRKGTDAEAGARTQP